MSTSPPVVVDAFVGDALASVELLQFIGAAFLLWAVLMLFLVAILTALTLRRGSS